jgi:aminoacylase
MQKFLQFRDEQEQKLTTEPGLKLGDVTTVNLTAMKSGVSDVFPFQNINVIPTEAYCAFDMRISPHVDLKSFEETHIKEWTKEEGVSYSFANKDTDNLPTSLDIDSNPYWSQCKAVFEKLQLEVVPQVFPAATDGRFLRRLNIPVFGFSPMNHTPVLLHDHDERLNSKVFLRGIEIYMELLPALSRTAVV